MSKKKLKQRIEALEARVAELEARPYITYAPSSNPIVWVTETTSAEPVWCPEPTPDSRDIRATLGPSPFRPHSADSTY